MSNVVGTVVMQPEFAQYKGEIEIDSDYFMSINCHLVAMKKAAALIQTEIQNVKIYIKFNTNALISKLI